MRTHDHNFDGDCELRPKAARIELEQPGLSYQAAGAGRTEALGTGRAAWLAARY